MRVADFALIGAVLFGGPAMGEMKVSFDSWGDIPKCTSGRPNKVGNPAFNLTGVPEGTTTVEFRLKDKNVPSFNHGGAKLRMSSSGSVPFGTFTYKSPCPPGGVHTYEWTAIARNAGGKVLETARAQRSYPE